MDYFRIRSQSLSKLRKGNHDEGSDGLINLGRMGQQKPCISPSCVLREFPLRSIHTIFAIDTLDETQLPEKSDIFVCRKYGMSKLNFLQTCVLQLCLYLTFLSEYGHI